MGSGQRDNVIINYVNVIFNGGSLYKDMARGCIVS